MASSAPQAIHKTYDELAIGHRVEMWDGPLGTVTAAVFHPTVIHDGSTVSFEATITLDCQNLRTFDSCGWPKAYPGLIIRRVRKYSSDMRWHYAIA